MARRRGTIPEEYGHPIPNKGSTAGAGNYETKIDVTAPQNPGGTAINSHGFPLSKTASAPQAFIPDLISQIRRENVFEGLIGKDFEAKEATNIQGQTTHVIPFDEKSMNHRVQTRKPVQVRSHPRYNELYDSLRSKQAWRHTADNFATGTITTLASTTVSAPVTLTNNLPTRLSQWPGGISLYLLLHSFNIGPSAITSNQGVNINVPATAGSATLSSVKGILGTVIVTATGTTNLTFTDGGTGNTIGFIPSSAIVGQVFTFNMPYSTLVANKAATTPVVTAGFTSTAALSSGLSCLFTDNAGFSVPLGVFSSASGGGASNDIVLPSPITDPSNLSIGSLLVSSQGDFLQYTFQFSIGYAYLSPQMHPSDLIVNSPFMEVEDHAHIPVTPGKDH